MFIAMNRFKVMRGSEAEFEAAWRSRERRLNEMAGFRAFASHTVWESEAAFTAWTRSEQFRAAHRGAGGSRPLFIGHPQFEGFTALEGI